MLWFFVKFRHNVPPFALQEQEKVDLDPMEDLFPDLESHTLLELYQSFDCQGLVDIDI